MKRPLIQLDNLIRLALAVSNRPSSTSLVVDAGLFGDDFDGLGNVTRSISLQK
jgi:hypothetical protein